MNSLFSSAFESKCVFVTGHTGFKGSWLSEWLLSLGAKVVGYSLPAPTNPSLFEQLQIEPRLRHIEGDILDSTSLKNAVEETQPDFVFHLAAQSLVRRSYAEPVLTYQTNVIGTIHVMEALRVLEKPCPAIMVTTDKCYENREWVYGYRENDPLGGHDPYSSSKAAAEIAVSSWRRSFFKDHPVSIASVRAGNVIGGGDWAEDRIVPDCMRALSKGEPISVRNPQAIRPWQHVLEPLGGYLLLAAKLSRDPSHELTAPFNFGPTGDGNRTVQDLVQEILRHSPGSWDRQNESGAVAEAKLLRLSTDRAEALLGWSPVWNFGQAVRHTVEWYVKTAAGANHQETTASTIKAYCASAVSLGHGWAA